VQVFCLDVPLGLETLVSLGIVDNGAAATDLQLDRLVAIGRFIRVVALSIRSQRPVEGGNLRLIDVGRRVCRDGIQAGPVGEEVLVS
jgi:hypothetical protein